MSQFLIVHHHFCYSDSSQQLSQWDRMDYFGADEVIGWDLHASAAATQAAKILTSTFVPTTTAASATTVPEPHFDSISLTSVPVTDLKLMPLVNSVELDVYNHGGMSLNNDLWVQFIIVTAVAFAVIFFVIFVVFLAACTLPSSTPLAAISSRRTHLIRRNELNPMLASTSV